MYASRCGSRGAVVFETTAGNAPVAAGGAAGHAGRGSRRAISVA